MRAFKQRFECVSGVLFGVWIAQQASEVMVGGADRAEIERKLLDVQVLAELPLFDCDSRRAHEHLSLLQLAFDQVIPRGARLVIELGRNRVENAAAWELILPLVDAPLEQRPNAGLTTGLLQCGSHDDLDEPVAGRFEDLELQLLFGAKVSEQPAFAHPRRASESPNRELIQTHRAHQLEGLVHDGLFGCFAFAHTAKIARPFVLSMGKVENSSFRAICASAVGRPKPNQRGRLSWQKWPRRLNIRVIPASNRHGPEMRTAIGEHWMKWNQLGVTALAAMTLVGVWAVSPSSEAQPEDEAEVQIDNDPAAKNILTLEITGIQEPEGKMACALFWQNKGFPRKHRRALRRTWVDAKTDTVRCVFKRTGLGEYAASVFLDRNNNGKLDTNAIGSPREPWGVSRNAKAKRFGPPLFKDAKFDYRGGSVTIPIELVYE